MTARGLRVVRSVAKAMGVSLRWPYKSADTATVIRRANARRISMYILHRTGMTHEQVAAELDAHPSTVGTYTRDVWIWLRRRPTQELSTIAARQLAKERECLRAK